MGYMRARPLPATSNEGDTVKKYAAKLVTVLLAPQLRPVETRLARAAFVAVLAWLGVKYG